jgi:transketolase
MALDKRSIEIRRTIIKTLEAGGRGHIGPSLSLVEILRVLYDHVLYFDAKNPKMFERDRFILSKGHGCLALYAMLVEKGYFPQEELWKFCKVDGMLGGHPEIKIPGVEAVTGSLGHGLSIGVGMALNARHEKASYRTFVVVGDGECNEGSIWEAALSAGKHKLSNLIVIVDYNKHQSYGSTFEVQDLEPFAEKWKAFGFGVAEVDGHDVGKLVSVFSSIPVDQAKPTAIIAHTVKGKGLKRAENNMKWHHKSKIEKGEIEVLLAELEQTHA